MCRKERLHYSCCSRTQSEAEARTRYCVLSYPIDKNRPLDGPRRLCERYKAGLHDEIITADFCCSDTCCATDLAAKLEAAETARQAREPDESKMIAKEMLGKSEGWKRISQDISQVFSTRARRVKQVGAELEEARVKHAGCAGKRAEWGKPQVFTQDDLETRREYEEPYPWGLDMA